MLWTSRFVHLGALDAQTLNLDDWTVNLDALDVHNSSIWTLWTPRSSIWTPRRSIWCPGTQFGRSGRPDSSIWTLWTPIRSIWTPRRSIWTLWTSKFVNALNSDAQTFNLDALRPDDQFRGPDAQFGRSGCKDSCIWTLWTARHSI